MSGHLFETAVAAASRLPEADREAIGALMLETIEADRRWEALLSKSGPRLEALMAEALAEYQRGECLPLDLDDLPE